LCDQEVVLQLENFYKFFQIFIGEIFIETKKIFTNNSNSKIQINPIADNLDFVRTNSLLKKFDYYKNLFKDMM